LDHPNDRVQRTIMERRGNKYYKQVQRYRNHSHRKEALLHATLWLGAIVLFLALWFWLGGCRPNIRDDEQTMWNDLQKEYPQSQAKKPKVIYNNDFDWIGMYYPELNLIITREYYDVLKHEMRHACGDMMEENYNATR